MMMIIIIIIIEEEEEDEEQEQKDFYGAELHFDQHGIRLSALCMLNRK